MRKNHVLQQIRQGQPSIGLWVQSQSVHIARIIAAQGWFDWLVLDMEHSPVDLSTASMMLATIADVSGGSCTPLARIVDGSMAHVKQALDSGAHGVIIPMINTAQEAADVVRFARYPSLGDRGAGGVTPHFGFGTTSQIEYIQHVNDEILVGLQIETPAAVENIEAITAVPGIDLIFVGPFDLQISLGLPPALWSDEPLFTAAVDKVMAACKQHGIPCGTFAPDAESAAARLADGFSFVPLGTDISQLLGGLSAQRHQLG